MDKKKFIIIDGSSMLVTCYYANLPEELKIAKEEEKELHYGKILQTSSGTYTNAVFGMLRIIKKLIKEQKPDYLCFCFDQTRKTFRTKIYPEYKGTRGKSPSPLIEQFLTMENILKTLGFMVIYDTIYEADDWAGSIAKKFASDKISVSIITKDHDYLQLVDDNITVWMLQATANKANDMYETYYKPDGINVKDLNLPYRIFEYTEKYVKKLEGVYPCQIPDLKGIVGDTSDNIPGVKGVSSAAVPLLEEYETVEGIYEAIYACNDDKKELKKLQNTWKEYLGIKRSPLNALMATSESEDNMVGEKAARCSKMLATIVTDIPIPFTLNDMPAKLDDAKFKEICEKYEFKHI